jgi:DNA-binding transcriptional MerR regulator
VSHYSIKDLERITGIKAHTLRVWEQRYKLFEPQRSETNIRSYTNDDLRRLLNVCILNNNGLKISQIAGMSVSELCNKVNQVCIGVNCNNTQIENLVIAMVEMDEERFEKIISVEIMKSGFDYVFTEIVHPFLDKVGIMWQTGCINLAQEHFISNLIRQKLIVAIDSVNHKASPDAKKFLLCLPEDEFQEISLLYMNYVLRKNNMRTYYLGQSVPIEDLKRVHDVHRPDYILCVLSTYCCSEYIQTYLDKLDKEFKGTSILLSGSQVMHHKIKLHNNMSVFKKPVELVEYCS